MEIDTGSDRTLMSISLANRLGIEVRYFVNPKLIVGVGGKKIKCEKYGIVKMRVRTINNDYVLLHFLTYIMDYDIPPLLGSDVMASLGCSISYKYKVLCYKKVTISLSGDKRELDERIGGKKSTSLGVVKFTLADSCCLRSGAVEAVRVKLTAEIPEGPHVLLGERSDVCVVDLACKVKEKNYETVLVNFGSCSVTLKRGAVLGSVVMESESTDIFSMDEVLKDDNIMKLVDIGESMEDAEQVFKGKDPSAMPLKEFPDRRKLNASQLDQFYGGGRFEPGRGSNKRT